ncbi:MAG TPA: type II toxin-antitoxin system prevent-host-death family antitoxin [Nitrospira sp.]|nr:type II toxin-antitoxin system prevent-host-death family antitoxin [Nitrospira sp.]
MKNKTRPKSYQIAPEIIVKRGKPAAVIIPLEQYRDMLARLEDAEDLKILKHLRKKPLRFRSLDLFLQETAGRVRRFS